MNTRMFRYPVWFLLITLLLAGCAGTESEPAVELETAVPSTAAPIPATETAVPTNTPIQPTATPEPSPTPINLVAVAQAFILDLNQGEDVSDYLAEDTAIVIEGDTPIFVETMVDFTAYAQEAGSQFTLTDCQQDETAVTCKVTETNDWLPIFQENLGESDELLAYDKFLFAMTNEGLVASLTLALEPDSIAPIIDFFIQFDDWLNVNEVNGAEGFFTETTQLIYNKQHGTQMAGLTQEFVDVMGQLNDLYLVSEEAYASGDYETAVSLYTDMLALKLPYTIQYIVLSLRADAYDQLGDFEAAINDYETAIAFWDTDPDILNNLCWDYVITEQPELALPYCDQSIALEPASSSMDSRGVAHGLLGDYEAAIADLEFVIADLENASDPELVAIREQRAGWITHMQNGQNPFTSATMAELRGEETPSTPTANTGGDTAAASTTAQDYYNMGESYAEKQQWQSAIDSYSQAIALAPQNPDYYGARGFVYGMANDISNMLTDFDQAIALGTQDGVVYFFRGMFYAATSSNEQAISHIETAIAFGLPPDLQVQAEALLNDLK